MNNYRTFASHALSLTCAGALALGPALARATEPPLGPDHGLQQAATGRKLLIAGGVLGGLGLLTATLGLGMAAGIHMGNPGAGKELVLDPGQDRVALLRTVNAMEGVGWFGVSLLLSGAVLAVLGGTKLRRARDSRVSAAFGPRSVGLAVRF